MKTLNGMTIHAIAAIILTILGIRALIMGNTTHFVIYLVLSNQMFGYSRMCEILTEVKGGPNDIRLKGKCVKALNDTGFTYQVLKQEHNIMVMLDMGYDKDLKLHTVNYYGEGKTFEEAVLGSIKHAAELTKAGK